MDQHKNNQQLLAEESPAFSKAARVKYYNIVICKYFHIPICFLYLQKIFGYGLRSFVQKFTTTDNASES